MGDRENSYIEKIAAIEWQMFGEVQNQGGRADCQDNYDTFLIMRTSQLHMWPEVLQASYLADLINAKAGAQNLLSYKYGYMMARTAPDVYKEIESELPIVSLEKVQLIDEIVGLQVQQMTALAQQYPIFILTARPIYKEQDSEWQTSFETYLWGELRTYSEATLHIYRAFMDTVKSQCLIENIMQETARQYGYASLAVAEGKLKSRFN